MTINWGKKESNMLFMTGHYREIIND